MEHQSHDLGLAPVWTYRKGRNPFTGTVDLDRWTVHRSGQLVGRLRRVAHGSARYWVTVFLMPEQFHRVEDFTASLELVRQLVGDNLVDPDAR